MVRFLRDAVPNIMAGAIGVILALVIGVGLYFVAEDIGDREGDSPATQNTSAAP